MVQFNQWLSKDEITERMKDISKTYKNIDNFTVTDGKDIIIKFNSVLDVSQIREIEFMWHSITRIDFENKVIKFSKRWDSPK